MQVTIKVGSQVTIPVGNTGFTVASSDPTVVSVSNAGSSIVLGGLKAGSSILTLKLANDLSVSLAVKVA